MTNLISKVWKIFSAITYDILLVRRAKKRLLKFATPSCKVLICIPYLKSGGSERVVANICRSLVDLYGSDSVAILVTDHSSFAVSLAFPENNSSSYPSKIRFSSITGLSKASYDDRTWTLMSAIMTMRPHMVINVNSQLLWDCFERFLPQLAAVTNIGTVAFCRDLDKRGHPIGYVATHLERMLPYLRFVISDNKSFVGLLKSTLVKAPSLPKVTTRDQWEMAKIISANVEYSEETISVMAESLSHHRPTANERRIIQLIAQKIEPKLDEEAAAKFHVIYQNFSNIKSEVAPRARSSRPKILWASRVTRQKFPEILPLIARLMPDCDIHAYGAREVGYRFPLLKQILLPGFDLGGYIPSVPNLFWHGGYKSFDALPINEFDAFLYTSLYDGIPNVLIEAGAARLPIVAPLIGGIGEIINDETGWLVRNHLDPREYADQLRAVLQNQILCKTKSDALVQRISHQHSYERFRDAVRDLVEGEPLRSGHADGRALGHAAALFDLAGCQ